MLSGAVLLASVFAGRTYSWCLLTQQVCSDECAADGCDDTHEGESGPVAHEPCCEDRALGELPSTAGREGPPAVPAPTVAILPVEPAPTLPSLRRLRPSAPLPPIDSTTSTRPRIAPTPSARCAVLQVFHC